MTSHKKDSYHHGNLKETLITKTLDTLETQPLEQISLRGLAKSIGVTPTAVYNHFSDKDALLIEAKFRAFDSFHERMEERGECRTGERSLEDNLVDMCRGYLDFAIEKPHLFELMFNWHPDPERIPEHLMETTVRNEPKIRGCINDLLAHEKGAQPSEYVSAVGAFFSWAFAHGITTLFRTGAIRAAVELKKWPRELDMSTDADRERVIREMMGILADGLKARVRKED